ncbi:MAG: NUDIX hydrolase [Acidobacteriota bacterium]|nr:NUDIX hydrolase [Acidobacteriota bacterium]
MAAWTTLTQRIAYENAWIRVREDRFIQPDGSTGLYGVVEIRPSVGVIARNGRGEIALVGQYRYTLSRYTWEIPRGGSFPGETDMLAVAQRELREETGVEAGHWQTLGAVDVCNGVTTDVQHLFLATALTHTVAQPDPVEDLTLRWVAFDDAVRMVLENQITEVCSAAAILKASYSGRL